VEILRDPDKRDRRAETAVFVVDGQPTLRAGLVSDLEGFDGIGPVESAGSVAEAWAHPALRETDVILLDATLGGAADFVSSVSELGDVSIVALAAEDQLDRAAALAEGGVVTVLTREDLTAERLGLTLRAVAAGATTMLAIWPGSARGVTAPPTASLTPGEQRVLALLAQGGPTPEIAEVLGYSERAVKNVLHAVVDKLGVRSRAQAVAHAVRDGLIY